MKETKQSALEEQKRACRERWFKNHVARIISQDENVTIIHWKAPDTGNYSCRFILHSGWLIVVGDIGEAVYQWSGQVTTEFLHGLDFGYFHGKCQASPSGRDSKQWDARIAFDNLQAWLTESAKNNPPKKVFFTERDKREWDAMESLRKITKATAKDEYENAVRELYYASGDGEEASMLCDYGKIPDCHAVGHFVGLQMAISQLQEKAV